MRSNVCTSTVSQVSFLRDTKSVGDLSELIVALELARAGYSVSMPLGENQRYDLIIDDGDKLSRVQVKTGRLRRGAILFNTYSSHCHRKGVACRPYTDQIDFSAFTALRSALFTWSRLRTRCLPAAACASKRPRMARVRASAGQSHI